MRGNGDGAANMISKRRRGIPCWNLLVHAISPSISLRAHTLPLALSPTLGDESRGTRSSPTWGRWREAPERDVVRTARCRQIRPAENGTCDCTEGRRCRDCPRALNPCRAVNLTPECVMCGLVPDRKATSMRPAAIHECVLERRPECIPNATAMRLVCGKKQMRTRPLSDPGLPEAR